jgi:hypothetical protein
MLGASRSSRFGRFWPTACTVEMEPPYNQRREPVKKRTAGSGSKGRSPGGTWSGHAGRPHLDAFGQRPAQYKRSPFVLSNDPYGLKHECVAQTCLHLMCNSLSFA